MSLRSMPSGLAFIAGVALGGLTVTPTAEAMGSTRLFQIAPAEPKASPTLVSEQEWERLALASQQLPMLVRERARMEASVAIAMRGGVIVPLPTDPGGGYTHEQHKRNQRSILEAGTLYRLTGDMAYAHFVRDILLAYADLYPTLGNHPAARNQLPGRLFWQTLNDSVWLVQSIQGYDAVRDALSPQDRERIDADVFGRMARFLSEETPTNFNRIHNHATWAVAGVGMTGYVLRDPHLVDIALNGLEGDSTSGFLRQIDRLFSPDGYYEEGPYYQRYALAPFVVFAAAIEKNQPELGIFEVGDGVLIKAVTTTVHSSYGGLFFPINDAIKDKGLDTEELVLGVAIAYARTQDPTLLSIARRQGRIPMTPDGLAVAEGLSQNLAQPFAFSSRILRDGPDGDRGGLAILRRGDDLTGQTLVMKNTAQGMGHGHYDRLNWLFFDNGQEVVTDYGSARYLNIEAKSGGVYLPENNSWAKQTIAHNTLVVDQTSQFDARLSVAEEHWPELGLFIDEPGLTLSSATMRGAYDGVVFTRVLALVDHPALPMPIVIDLMKADADRAVTYDLPLHFSGQIMTVGFEAERAVSSRSVLGDGAGYQHLWVDANSPNFLGERSLSWMLNGRFYTYRFVEDVPSQALLVESGANDPDFNLRREPALIRRVEGQPSVRFVSVLEPHGRYDGVAETVTDGSSRIRHIAHAGDAAGDVIVVTLVSGEVFALGVSAAGHEGRNHRLTVEDRVYAWTGPYARFDQ